MVPATHFQVQHTHSWQWGRSTKLSVNTDIRTFSTLKEHREDIKFLKVAFKHFDSQKNKYLTKDDLHTIKSFLEWPAGVPDTDELFRDLGGDVAGHIHMLDWVQNMPDNMKDVLKCHPLAPQWTEWSRRGKRKRAEVRFLQYTFNFFDREHKGTLTKADLALVLNSMELPSTCPDVDKLFQILDENKDDEVHLEDWVNRLPVSVKDALMNHTEASAWTALARSSLEEVMPAE